MSKNRAKYLVVSKKDPFSLRKSRLIERLGLYLSISLLAIGLTGVLLDKSGFLAFEYGEDFRQWSTWGIFMTGAILSVVSVPYLYYSSFRKFRMHDNFWNEEFFWILPTFFAGTFFQYYGGSFLMIGAVATSLGLVFLIHLRLMVAAYLAARNDGSFSKAHNNYWEGMQYLTMYYFVAVLLLLVFDPLRQIMISIR